MKKYLNLVMGSGLVLMVAGCGVSTPNIVKVEKPTSAQPQVSIIQQEPELKRKVAIARFGNEAQYGKSALFGLH